MWSKPFHQRPAWRKLARQHKALERAAGNYRCRRCGSTESLESDHILPRSKYPDLALKMYNLGLLCRPCNGKKGTNTEMRPSVMRVLFIRCSRASVWATVLATAVYYLLGRSGLA